MPFSVCLKIVVSRKLIIQESEEIQGIYRKVLTRLSVKVRDDNREKCFIRCVISVRPIIIPNTEFSFYSL